MIAFVLKNNEGLYYTTHLYYEDIHTEDISEASIYNRKIANDMKLFLNKSTYGEKWKVVEITIAENGLKHKIGELKDQKQSVTMDDESISMIDTIHDLEDENIQLKEELAKQDQEIKTLKKALELACEILENNDEAYKLKSKQRTKEKYLKLLLKQAKENKDVED